MNVASVVIESSQKVLSSCGGLIVSKKIYDELGIMDKIKSHLPTMKIKTRASSEVKFEALCLGLIAGADCLDDMERLSCDELFRLILDNKINAANTYGEFLRSFQQIHCKELNHSLIDIGFSIREKIAHRNDPFILDLDSTPHVQHGLKMEGVEWNYKGQWCLDSLQAFDQYGIQYWMMVRPGATFSSNSSAEVIDNVMRRIPKDIQRFSRADSAFCNVDYFNACFTANAKFVCAMRENMYAPILEREGHRLHWKRAKKGVRFHDKREVEVCSSLYRSEGGHETLRIVFLRAKKENKPGYDHCAFITNMGAHEWSDERVVLFYRGRANCENSIKEGKYGFDLKHFPCLKLSANKAYGIIAAFAYNVMRYMAHLLNPKIRHFAKQIRFRMINLACQVVRHARQIILRFNPFTASEVTRWLTTIKFAKDG